MRYTGRIGLLIFRDGIALGLWIGISRGACSEETSSNLRRARTDDPSPPNNGTRMV
jgi:hypothetical protein